MAALPTYIYGDTCTAVLNIARSRVDDLLITPSGSPSGAALQDTEVGGAALLRQRDQDDNVFRPTQVIFNAAWIKLQRFLMQNGWRGLIRNLQIDSLPENVSDDMGAQSWLSWNGAYDGSTVSEDPALPIEFVSPLKLQERLHDDETPAGFTDMSRSLYGLRTVPARTELNRQWEWRDNALWFTGATETTDLLIRFVSLFPEFEDSGSPIVPWYDGQIPIPRASSALAWYIAYEVCVGRIGEADSQGILNNAQTEALGIMSDQRRVDGVEPITGEPLAAPEEATV